MSGSETTMKSRAKPAVHYGDVSPMVLQDASKEKLSQCTGVGETSSKNRNKIAVIGAGLMRTGTWSLKCALERLYEKPCYHMSEIFFKRRKVHIKLWLDMLKMIDSPDMAMIRNTLDTLYDGFGSAVDYPTCLFYKHLMMIYPEAKVILTVRDPDEWIASCRATTLSVNMMRPATMGEGVLYWYKGITDIDRLHIALFRHTFGPNFSVMSDAELKEVYLHWNQEVMKTVPQERLLVFHAREGWNRLCGFLNLPIPLNDCPFPHVNKREEFVESMQRTFDRGKLIQLLIYGMMITGVLVAYLCFMSAV